MKSTIFLVRHAVTDWNESGRLQGQKDIPLNSRGEKQAQQLAQWFLQKNVPVSGVFCSDLIRAVKTAEAIAHALGLRAQIDPRFRERDLGAAEGNTWDEVLKKFFPQWQRERFGLPSIDDLPDVEPRFAVIQRVNQGLLELVADRSGVNFIVVSHGSALTSWLQWRFRLPQRPRLKNGAVVMVVNYPTRGRVKLIESTAVSD